MKVGLIVVDPEVDDVVLKSSRSWLENIPKRLIFNKSISLILSA